MKRKYFIWLFIILTYTLFLHPSLSEANTNLPVNTLKLSINQDMHQIKGRSIITIPENQELVLEMGFLNVTSLLYNNVPLRGKENKKSIRLEAAAQRRILEIEYELTADGMGSQGVTSSSQGMLFSDGWFPRPEGLAFYELSVNVPQRFEAISEADDIRVQEQSDKRQFSFDFDHPLESISLIVGQYSVFSDKYDDIELYTYFFEDNKDLAENYLALSKKYLTHYEKLFGKYKYKRFSIVENFLPTGFAMPTFTSLGQSVIRLPQYVVESFLSHEILHQWFGCLVYVDDEKGNWSEGLVTFLSDYYQYDKAQKSQQYRKEALLNSYYYVPENKAIPFTDFQFRKDRLTKVIGYDRVMMFFYMLQNKVGKKAFYNALRRLTRERQFQKTSWDDIQNVMEGESQSELAQFFNQWTHVSVLPAFSIEDVCVVEEVGGAAITFRIMQNQKGAPLTYDLPVLIKTTAHDVLENLFINKENNYFKVSLPGMPREIIADEEFSLLRSLHSEEVNPVIAGLLADDNKIIINPHVDKKYEDLIQFFKKRKFKDVSEKKFIFDDLKDSSVLVLGYDSSIIKKILGPIKRPKGDFVLEVFKNPFNAQKVIALAEGDSKEIINRAGRKIFHYGNYSFLCFQGSKVVEKKISSSVNGIKVTVMKPEMAFKLSSSLSLDHVVDDISDKKIVYIGESHNRYEHHVAQLAIIKRLYEKGIKIAIGMEMFIPSQQDALDQYINGKIDEKEFLHSSRYFEYWNLDYNMYRGILQFARTHKIPVIGLNIETEIVKKVSSKGLSALSESEKNELPEYIDLTDSEYKKRLETPFKMHKGFEDKDMDNFFNAQVLRDEAMAQGIVQFLYDKPSYTMVVIAGGGHIAYGAGIPKRVHRLNKKPYATILNASSDDIGQDSADYVIYPSPLESPEAPKLMVMIKENDGLVEIVDFPKNSVSEAAGIKKGDIIRTIDGTAIKDTQDIRVMLFFKKHGDTVKVRVKRKKFIIEEEEIDFNVTL